MIQTCRVELKKGEHRTMKNENRFERTTVLLKPELLSLNLINWVVDQIKLTGCQVLTNFRVIIPNEILVQLPPKYPVALIDARIDHLGDKRVTILVIEGPDAVNRIRTIVGKQHDPEDWSVNSIRGKLRDEYGLQWLQRDDGKKYFMDYLECPQSMTAAKQALRWVKQLSVG